MSDSPMIYKAISATMNDCGAVTKNDFNSFDKYKFRGIDAVMNALNPAMRKNGIFVVPEVMEHSQEERTSKKGDMMIYTVVKVKYTFYAEDGSNVVAVVYGEAMDRSDKSTNKAMSAAFKYACFQTFCIPTEDFMDADAESPDPAPREEKKQNRKTQKQPEQQAPPPEHAESELPGYPPLEKMCDDLKELMKKDKTLETVAKRAMEVSGARDLAELAFIKKELIAAWWEKKCKG